MKRALKVIGINALLIGFGIGLIFIKFKPAYKVTLNGEELGYVSSEKKFQQQVDEQILKSDESDVAFVALDNLDYSYSLVERSLVNDENTFSEVSSKSKKIYRVYEVSSDNSEDTVYVKSEDEANAYVSTLKEKYNKVEANLKINVIYVEDVVSDETILAAKTKMENVFSDEQNDIIAAEKKKAAAAAAAARKKAAAQQVATSTASDVNASLNGITLASLPVKSYTISSRFGTRRGTKHTGLDLAAPVGTPIYAAASGTVVAASSASGGYSAYGKLIKIDHGNGVQTWYAHCSEIVVSVGQYVSAGQLIGKVGTTGRATGPHCHFEVRVNGVAYNPQNWIY